MKLELRIIQRDSGGWNVELWRAGEMAECYLGAPSLGEAVDLGVAWLRDERGRR